MILAQSSRAVLPYSGLDGRRAKPRILFRASGPADIPWFTQATNYWPGPQFGGIVAQDEFGALMGMVGFDGWTPNSVVAHFAIPRPRCILPLWSEVCKYLHSHGRKKILGVTPSDNYRALRVIRKLGWTIKSSIVDGWSDGVDLVISEYEINVKVNA